MSIPLSRKLLYTTVTTAFFLLLLEGALAMLPAAFTARRAPADAPLSPTGTVLCVGDSVTAGVGVPAGQAWPDHLGRSLLRHDIALQREALPGAGVDFAAGAPLQRLSLMPDDAAPTVLVMLGHNDMVRWAPGARWTFQAIQNDGGVPTAGGEAARWRGLRLVRAARWMWLVAAGSGPQVSEVDAEALSARMVSVYTPLRDAAAARRGQLVLLTYLVPGVPPEGLREDAAAVLRSARAAQLTVNRAIRAAGDALGVEVIDLAEAVEVEEVWRQSAFVDHIHPSAKSSARAAAVLYERVRP